MCDHGMSAAECPVLKGEHAADLIAPVDSPGLLYGRGREGAHNADMHERKLPFGSGEINYRGALRSLYTNPSPT
jgi:hypothetical protein